MNVEQNDVRPYMSELTQRHHDGSDSYVDKDSTNDQCTKIYNEDEQIALIISYRLVVSSLLPHLASLDKHTQ